MEFTDALKKLESSHEFKLWQKENPGSYLSHGFIMDDAIIKQEWQIGFVSKDEKITTFSVSEKEPVIKNPEAEVFKDERKILGLDVGRVKVHLGKALEIAEKLQKEKYSVHSPFKKIVILQNLDVGQVWNVTYVTNTFKTLNMKIDAETGDVVKHEVIDFFKVER